jgi:hypothetical protein
LSEAVSGGKLPETCIRNPISLFGEGMAISDQRRRWIETLAREEHLDHLSDEELEAFTETDFEREYDAFFASVTDPEELHIFADAFNWDCELEKLTKVIHHPLCDRGTALLVYWRGQPAYFLRYGSRAKIPYFERENFDLLREIERRMTDGGYARFDIPYDPTNDAGTDQRPKRREVERFAREIPAMMYPDNLMNRFRP